MNRLFGFAAGRSSGCLAQRDDRIAAPVPQIRTQAKQERVDPVEAAHRVRIAPHPAQHPQQLDALDLDRWEYALQGCEIGMRQGRSSGVRCFPG